MHAVKLRLEAWREAEHRRDGLAPGSPEWQQADEELRNAEKAFHGEEAQEYARYAEAEFEHGHPWSAHVDRRTSGAGIPVVRASIARLPRG
jgi:hypothetical protein